MPRLQGTAREVYQHETTIAEQAAHNIQIHEGISEDEFVKMRTECDATLAVPRLLLPSIQANMNAGRMPFIEANDQAYFKIPLNRFRTIRQEVL